MDLCNSCAHHMCSIKMNHPDKIEKCPCGECIIKCCCSKICRIHTEWFWSVVITWS